MTAPILEVHDLSVSFLQRQRHVKVVDRVSLTIDHGQVAVLVGESGSGKTVFSRTVGGMRPRGSHATGTVAFGHQSILTMSRHRLRRLHGGEIGFVAQDPTSSLDPMRRVGSQITEVLMHHSIDPTRAGARRRALDLLDMVRIVDPERVARRYPHELSGGMRQRVSIAIALACQPALLIADEPSSALDAAVGARVIDLMDDLRTDLGTSVLFITHDFAAAARIASRPDDQVAVMLNGRIVERGPAARVLTAPYHAYTKALLAAEPSGDVPRGGLATVPDSVRQARYEADLDEVAPMHFVTKEAS